MKASDLLRSQHREVERLFEQLRKAEGDDAKRSLCDELARLLVAHTAIENEIFYPAAREVLAPLSQLEEVLEAEEEHRMVDFALHRLLAASFADESTPARMRVLEELVRRHVDEEERTLLPGAEEAMGDERAEDLGASMEMRFEEVSAEGYEERLAERLGLVMGAARGARRAPAKPRRRAAKAPAKPARARKKAAKPSKPAPRKRRATKGRATKGGARKGSRTSRAGR